MAGALKTLFGALQASTFLTGVNLAFGEERVMASDTPPPFVVLVPTGGAIDNNPGYAAGLDPAVEMIWGIHETVELHLWGFSSTPNAQPIDHADAVETLRQQVLSALRDQQAQYADVTSVAYGLSWKPVSERWATMQDATSRGGRSLVITVAVEISVPMNVPQVATITTEQINQTFVDQPS